MPTLNIDARSLRRVATRLKQIDQSAADQLRAGVAQATTLVATRARTEALGYSPKIASTIKTFSGASAGRISIGNRAVPYAALFEGRDGPKWRHPTFGHRPWVSQDARPVLRPTLQMSAREVVGIIGSHIEESWIEALSGG